MTERPPAHQKPDVSLSVAICTRNRHRLLDLTLDSLRNVVVEPNVEWEVLVVDNGSSDETAAVMRRYADTLPLRAVSEDRVGLSHARNAAVSRAHGDYLLWIDDDVIVDRLWLSAYADAIRRFPDAAFFGGPITPLFEGTPPAWLLGAIASIGNAYAALDLGPDPVAFSGGALPYGANLALRMFEQRRESYDPRLGRRDTELFAGEEWAVLQKLLECGATGRWVPGARVQHVITPARQSLRYLRRYYAGNGASHALVRRNSGEPMLLGRPRWIWREAVTHEIAYRLTRVFAAPDVWCEHLKRSSVAWGMLRPSRAARTSS